jgi:putative addiction module component (TIGR02574 family)
VAGTNDLWYSVDGFGHEWSGIMKKSEELGIDRMSLDDRLALAHEILDGITEEAERTPLTEGQRRELDRRLADSQARPDAVTPWEEVKAKALARARK